MLYDHVAVPSPCHRVRTLITLISALTATSKVRSRWPQFIWEKTWRLNLHSVLGDHSQQRDQKLNVGSEPRYRVVLSKNCRINRIYTQWSLIKRLAMSIGNKRMKLKIMMPVCVQNVDMTVRYNAHSHSFSDTNIFMQTQWHNSYPNVENRNYYFLKFRCTTDTSRLKQFSNSKTEWKQHFFKTSPGFFHMEMKAELGEGGGKILLGDTTGVGAVELRPIRFQCIEAWISVGLSCTGRHIQLNIHSVPTCAEPSER
jgi:hypothetical protein